MERDIKRFSRAPQVEEVFRNLFNNKDWRKELEQEGKDIVDYFKSILKENGIKYVISFKVGETARRSILYHLIHASNNLKAVDVTDKSSIEWTNSTWNMVTGCDKVSPGCKNCYAERFANRLQKLGVAKYRDGFKLTVHPDIMDYPLRIKKPKMIFVNSMSDLFHEKISFDFISKVFEVIKKANWHQYQILTKRSQRLKQFGAYYGKFPPNVWIGVSVEMASYKTRIDDLKNVQASVHFLSLEPLLGPLGRLDLDDIEWVIAGGESGFNFRACNIEWISEIRDQCIESTVPFFFKQWGGITSKANGRTLDNKIWNEFPKSYSDNIQQSISLNAIR